MNPSKTHQAGSEDLNSLNQSLVKSIVDAGVIYLVPAVAREQLFLRWDVKDTLHNPTTWNLAPQEELQTNQSMILRTNRL